MDTKLKVAAFLNIASGALCMLTAMGVFLMMSMAGTIAAFSGEPGAGGIIGILAVVIASFLFVLGLPAMLGGWGLLSGKDWAKPVLLVLSFLNLFNFPIGTIIGGFTFWALLSEPSRAPATPQQG